MGVSFKPDWKNKDVVLAFASMIAASIVLNLATKSALQAIDIPLILSFFQLIGSFVCCVIWRPTVIEQVKLIWREKRRALVDLSVAYLVGIYMTTLSLGRLTVAFTHIIKACEPLSTVLISKVFSSVNYSGGVYLSLAVTVLGVLIASASEVAFELFGFAVAMTSNLGFGVRNVLSKILLEQERFHHSGSSASHNAIPVSTHHTTGAHVVTLSSKHKIRLDNFSLFAAISLVSAVLCLPLIVCRFDLHFFLNLNRQQTSSILITTFSNAVYQLSTLSILQKVSTLSHALTNSLKRILIIFSSFLYFGNSASGWSLVGAGVALFGMFLYITAKDDPLAAQKTVTAPFSEKVMLALRNVLSISLFVIFFITVLYNTSLNPSNPYI